MLPDFRSIKFLEPQIFDWFNLVGSALIFFIVVLLVRYRNRPPRSAGSSHSLLGHLKFWILLIIAAAIAIMAAARPYVEEGAVLVKRGNVEAIVLLDGSSSMWVDDVLPSRLDVATREILNMYGSGAITEGDKVALIVFGRNSRKKLRPSTYLQRFVNEVSFVKRPVALLGDMFPWGSDIPLVLEDTYEMLDDHDKFLSGDPAWRPTPKSNRFILFFGDGNYEFDEARKKRFQNAMIEFKKRGLPIYTVGIGTQRGIPLDSILDRYKRGVDYDESLAKDISDEVTVLDQQILKMIGTGGIFLIEQGNVSAERFLQKVIDSHRSKTIEVSKEPSRQELWREFLILALIFMALAFFSI